MVKKVPLIPPLRIGNTIVLDLRRKCFNMFFASQCVPLNNDSNILYCQRYMANAKMSSIKFENKDIINVIKALDPCKVDIYGDISIRMLITYFSRSIIYFQFINLVFIVMTHISTSLYLLSIPFTRLLMLSLFLI